MPKALLSVANKPIIEHILDKIKKLSNINEIFLITNNKFYNKFVKWKIKYHISIPFKILNDNTNSEEDKLGAVGDIYFAIKKESIDDDVLIIASDNLFDFDLKKLVNFFKEKKESVIALFDVKDREIIKGKYGAIILGNDNKIIDVEEKPMNPKTSIASTACYIFSRKDLTILSKYFEQNNKIDNLGCFIKFLVEKGKIYGLIFKGRWFDIGGKEHLIKANEEWA